MAERAVLAHLEKLIEDNLCSPGGRNVYSSDFRIDIECFAPLLQDVALFGSSGASRLLRL
jgi:hypothetical protein